MSEQSEAGAEIAQSLVKFAREYRIGMTEINDAAKRREQVSLRNERRVAYWMRISMGGLLLVVILLLLLTFILFSQLNNLSEQVRMLTQTLNQDTTQTALANTVAPGSLQHTNNMLKLLEIELKSLNANAAKIGQALQQTTGNETGTTETESIQDYRLYNYR